MMRVGFDISQTAYAGGVATYTRNLASELSKLKDLEMVYFYSSLRKPYLGNLPNVKKFFLPPTLLGVIFNKTRLIPIEKFIGEVDIFHSSDWTQPKTFAKKVTTYHDVVPLKYPQWSHPKIVEVHKKRLQIVEKEIDMVIAVSESTKKDLLEISQIPEEKITVIYEGVDHKIFKPLPENKVEEFKKKKGLPNKFVLSIGGVGERRNLKRVKEAARNYNLIITGEDLWVEDKDLPLLYNSATVLLYPSLYEGFGLPIIEAMACGVPVITSNISSMPEAGGDAALYVDPNSVSDIEKKLKTLIKDKKLQKDLIKKGFQQAKKFSWEKCARETIQVYRKVVKK